MQACSVLLPSSTDVDSWDVSNARGWPQSAIMQAFRPGRRLAGHPPAHGHLGHAKHVQRAFAAQAVNPVDSYSKVTAWYDVRMTAPEGRRLVGRVEGPNMTICSPMRAVQPAVDSWVVSKVTTMIGMFSGAEFRPGRRLVGRLEGHEHEVLSRVPFNQAVNSWNVSQVKDMSMFKTTYCPCDSTRPSTRGTSRVTNGIHVQGSIFNQAVDSWDVRRLKKASDVQRRDELRPAGSLGGPTTVPHRHDLHVRRHHLPVRLQQAPHPQRLVEQRAV